MVKKIKLWPIGVVLLLFGCGLWYLSRPFPLPAQMHYGVTFSKPFAEKLGLDWKELYAGVLDDLGARKIRLPAYWNEIESKEGVYDFSDLEWQVKEAEKRNATIILAVGHRLPGWPECHTPEWVSKLTLEQYRQELVKYVETVVNRYKNSPSLLYWQVENELFLSFFARSSCGLYSVNSEEILKEEIDLVHRLDPAHPVLVTDSGEFGTWYKAYRSGDAFGTSIYLYVWWRNFLGPIRYPITPAFFRIKHSLTRLIYGTKPSIVIELSSEPWLLQPIVETSLDIQLERMGIDKFNEMINFSSKTGFDTFYLWGAEWWYWLSMNGHPEFWDRAKELYRNSP